MDSLKLTPKNVGAILGVSFITSGATVTGFKVAYEINYGKFSLPMENDMWAELTEAQKTAIQNLYTKLEVVLDAAVAASI